jgi:hypothetical protein
MKDKTAQSHRPVLPPNPMKRKPNLVAAGLFLAAVSAAWGQPSLQFTAST